MADYVVRLLNVCKTFSNGLSALSDVSLGVGKGEFLTLLGPSGCGKSTVLRVLAGLEPVSSGEVRWTTEGGKSAGRSDLAFVFQEPTLMPWRTVEGNVSLPLSLRGLPKSEIRGRVASALEMVGLGGFGRSYPRQLSGGMKMRVSIARALAMNPRILLMDEPFAALDEITRHRLNDDLVRLWREKGLTIVFVTHSVYEAAYLSTRLVVMSPRPGRIHINESLQARPSQGDDFRASPEYISRCQAISLYLRAVLPDHKEVVAA